MQQHFQLLLLIGLLLVEPDDAVQKLCPTNIIGAAFNFDKREYFKLDAPAERETPKVSFS